jgi:hypothetical protein
VTYPGKEKSLQDLHIEVAIQQEAGPVSTSLHHVLPLRVFSVIDLLPYAARVAIISTLTKEADGVDGGGIVYKLPSRYLRYNAIPGSDFANQSKEEVDEMRANEACLTTGWLYGRKPLEYAPEKLFGAGVFFEPESQLNTDCLVHAVNYALRFPFFVQRE